MGRLSEVNVPGRTLLVALLVCLGAGGAVRAGPFAEVPGSDRAYGDWAYLAERGLVTPPLGRALSARDPITRTDFALALLPLAQSLVSLGEPGGAPALRQLLAALPAQHSRQAGARMVLLLSQFQPELKLMDQDTEAALASARRLEAGQPGLERASNLRPTEEARDRGAAGLRYRLLGTEVGVTYSHLNPERAPLALLPTRALAPSTDAPAASRLAPSAEPGGFASRELMVRSLRGSVEYDLTRSLTLSLAYEALLQGADGVTPLDDTSLKTVGVGYRLSPSASLKLRYHLVDYREPFAPTGWQRDQVAETELVIRF